MKKILFYLFILCVVQKTMAQNQWSVTSPDKGLQLVLTNNGGSLSYRILSGTTEVIRPSVLGIERKDEQFTNSLSFVKKTSRNIADAYTMVSGKRKQNKTTANETVVVFRNSNGAQLQIELRAYNDGVAFRYHFPDIKKSVTVTKESTSFVMPASGKVWAQPYDLPTEYTPGYESTFVNGEAIGTAARNSGGWALPALFAAAGHYILLTESNLDRNYFGMHLQQDAQGGIYKLALPLEGEGQKVGSILPTAVTPFATPWRTFIIGKKLGTIVESNLVHHLAKANTLGDVSWVKPGRSSWSWWGDHDSSKDYEKLKKFVDLAKEMGWEYSLVDANWNIMNGGTMEQLAQYAASKGVKLALWYNSGGAHNTVTEQPRDIMSDSVKRKAEFKRLRALGVKGIKVDFFQSDKQFIIQQYQDILKDAARENIVVNFHGCTIPRGWSRTYPNLLSMEAVRGAENYGWGKDFALQAARQNNIFPYTRNVIGPMDYTPVTFSDYECCVHTTTNAHELALSVLFETGILHFADRAAPYQAQKAEVKAFLRTVPVTWDDTKFVQGTPGSETVIARRNGNTWYIAGSNGDSLSKTVNLQLPFLKGSNYMATLYADGDTPRDIKVTTQKLNTSGTKVDMLPNGGFVMVVKPVK